MIKKYSDLRWIKLNSVALALLCVLEAALINLWADFELAMGFSAGLGAFFIAFLGIEIVAGKVFSSGSVKAGVLDSLFWAGVKFFGPIALIYYAVGRGFSVVGIFGGLVLGLVSISLILWFRNRFLVKSD